MPYSSKYLLRFGVLGPVIPPHVRCLEAYIEMDKQKSYWKNMFPRWFKVTFLSLIWRSRFAFERVTNHHPKKGSFICSILSYITLRIHLPLLWQDPPFMTPRVSGPQNRLPVWHPKPNIPRILTLNLEKSAPYGGPDTPADREPRSWVWINLVYVSPT